MAAEIRVLVADDDPLVRRVLARHVGAWGYGVVEVEDGVAAWRLLDSPSRPPVALIDWMMPGMDGPDICRRVRAAEMLPSPYLILVTARERPEDVVVGLDAGANDYLVKPVNPEELRARLAVGVRMAQLERELVTRVRELEAAQTEIRQLQEILPICSVCKKIRDDAGAYHQLESYISQHSNVVFSHGYCPDCAGQVMRELDAWKTGDR